MYKTIIAAALLATSIQSHAMCSTKAFATDGSIRGNILTDLFGYTEFNITNQTSSTQTYQICHELSTQMFDHTYKYTTAWCEPVTLVAGQSTGSVRRNLTVQVKYPSFSSGAYYISHDSVITVRGECNSDAHVIKKIKVLDREA